MTLNQMKRDFMELEIEFRQETIPKSGRTWHWNILHCTQ